MGQNILTDLTTMSDYFDDPTEAVIYLYLQELSLNQNGTLVHVSLKEIARNCMCGKTAVETKINKLIEKGHVQKIRTLTDDGGFDKNMYAVSLKEGV